MSNVYIGNTDNDWFDFLKSNQPLQDINFWKPGRGKTHFKALEEGEAFLFRLKSPRNKIGGYGYLTSSVRIPISLTWDEFGIRNGVDSLTSMVSSISKYRNADTHEQSLIGCRILCEPVFLNEEDWLDVPESWSNSIVSGKTYNAEDSEIMELFHNFSLISGRNTHTKLSRHLLGEFHEPDSEFRHNIPIVKFGKSQTSKSRLGQSGFKSSLIKAYNSRCAISNSGIIPVLEAAHIRPYSGKGTHEIYNGLLLRKDLHALFDAGLLTITEDYFVKLHPLLSLEYEGIEEYSCFDGKKIFLPEKEHEKPNAEHLSWHWKNICKEFST